MGYIIGFCIFYYLIIFELEDCLNRVYRINHKFNYSIRVWYREIYNWLLVPDFGKAKFSKFSK